MWNRAEIFATLLLVVGATAYIGFGVWFMVKPRAIELYDIMLVSGNARADVRAVYGGLQIGVGLVLLAALPVSTSCFSPLIDINAGLFFGAATTGCFGMGRLIGICIEGFSVDLAGSLYMYLALELGFATLCMVALMLRRRSNRKTEPDKNTIGDRATEIQSPPLGTQCNTKTEPNKNTDSDGANVIQSPPMGIQHDRSTEPNKSTDGDRAPETKSPPIGIASL